MLALVWSAVGVFAMALGRYATPDLVNASPGGRLTPRLPPPPPDLPTLLYQLGVGSIMWYAAAAALPLLIVAARRVDAEQLGLVRTLAIAFGATAALVVATSGIDYAWTYGGAPVRPPVAAYVTASLRQHGLPWMALMGVVIAIEARRRTIRSLVERERLQAEVAKQRLIALAGQLRPHFLFNTLQAISTLIHRDPDAADDMLTKLSDLLSDVLRHRDSPFVRLEDELRYARTWLEIAKVRFGDRLAFEIDVPEALHDLSVPLFILQPLIENALSHGVGAVLRGGRVTVRARTSGGRLWIAVIDEGAGLALQSQRREGIGLTNTRERLAASFGPEQSLTLESHPSAGTTVRIEMPATPMSQSARES